MDGAQRGIEEPPGAGLDTGPLTSTRVRGPNPVVNPAPLIRTPLVAVSTPLPYRAEIALTLAEVVQGHAAAALILYAELPPLRHFAPLTPKHAARAILQPAVRSSARDRGQHSVFSINKD
jgi:hypothetical protein